MRAFLFVRKVVALYKREHTVIAVSLLRSSALGRRVRSKRCKWWCVLCAVSFSMCFSLLSADLLDWIEEEEGEEQEQEEERKRKEKKE